MGLLALGTPLDWPETKPLAEHIRNHGITQFLNTWKRWKDRSGEGLLWGDEIEMFVTSLDDSVPAAYLSLRQSEILEKLKNVTEDPELQKFKPAGCRSIPTFHPEYGRYMIESTPGCPYTGSLKDLLTVEIDMRFRRKIVRSHLLPNELPITLTSWPRLGVENAVFTDPSTKPDPEHSASKSQYVGQLITNPHARFPTLTANIRQRRGSLVDIRVPLYVDKNTVLPDGVKAPLSGGVPPPAKPEPGTPYIHMDAMGFGMGCSCLQITFQAFNVQEARTVYDALVPIAPIMLALTAAAPAFRGRLADVDARWNVIAASVDDRTEEERGLKPLKDAPFTIPKSRYDSVSLYIANDARNKPEYSDVYAPINEKVRERLVANGLDNKIASHFAHLFIRDPLVQFSETIDQDDEKSMDHFENIQSTNWQTVRFKPPPVDSPIGWRVEFRSMEIQPTDFENAALSIFIVLLSRAIISFDLNFYQPLSQVDENMQRAQQRNAARANKFWFRRQVFPEDASSYDLESRPVSPPNAVTPPEGEDRPLSPTAVVNHVSRGLAAANGHANGNGNGHGSKSPLHTLRKSGSVSSCTSLLEEEEASVGPEFAQMTLDEVINGRGEFPGLLGVVNAYINSINADVQTKCEIRRYLDLIKLRAKGELVTPATYIRNFITTHPDYKHDSIVSDKIQYDLVKAVDEVERGVRAAPELLGKDYVGSGTGVLNGTHSHAA
ncbi:Glutamate--cysteine ligase [Vanrija pseudolonga]|uniref:Glutamate--cysteine ligase n=1 Tax=Vanrija pseudolonga TaxID=143232 RepID=A0AAF0YH10_9TREE|nr:Glutamate--cysteine ligase [Vanrija pseudolonga]